MANHRIIATAGIIAVSVGTINSVAKDRKLPSSRFLIGSGVAFLILSAMADLGIEEVANAFAIAIATFVVLGDGGGVLSYINSGEMDTRKQQSRSYTPKSTEGQPPTSTSRTASSVGRPRAVTPSIIIPNMN